MRPDAKATNRAILKITAMVMEPEDINIHADHTVVFKRRNEERTAIETVDDAIFNVDMSRDAVETTVNTVTTMGERVKDTVPDAELGLTWSQSAELQNQEE